MSGKTRAKVLDHKLVVEPVRPFNMILNNSSYDRNSHSKPRPRAQLSKHSNLISSHSPPPSHTLEAILAKHTIKQRNFDKSSLNSRPKTVLSLKKKAKISENSSKLDESSPVTELPRFNIVKKENSKIANYEIGDEIGKGAFGTVYLARNLETGEKVAIKCYDKSTLITPNQKKGVQREIKILSKISHMNVVKLVTTLENSVSLNLVFEYVSGCSLKDYLYSRSLKRIEEGQGISIMSQILGCVEYLHGMGICHRDLKLENILIDENHLIKLVDFGFSTYILNNKKVQLYCGTFYYMAPEVLLNKESVGPPIDIWACGVLIYVLLTGTFPFKGRTKLEIYSKMQSKNLVFYGHMSTEVKELLSSIFEVEPDMRPTAKEILNSNWINSWKNKSMINRTLTY